MKQLIAVLALFWPFPVPGGELFLTCQPTPGSVIHCWDSQRNQLAIERHGDFIHVFDPNTGRTVARCEVRQGAIHC